MPCRNFIAGSYLLRVFASVFLCLAARNSRGQDWTQTLKTEKAWNEVRISAIDAEAAPIAAKLHDVNQEIARHNVTGCTAPADDPNACVAYDEKAAQLNSLQQSLRSQLQPLAEESDCRITRNKQIDQCLSCISEARVCRSDPGCNACASCGSPRDTVANFALDPRLARIDIIELQQVQARINRLHQALAILNRGDQETSSEWQALHQEMEHQSREIQWQALLFATASAGELLKVVSAEKLQKAEALFRHEIWTRVPVEEAKLRQLAVSADPQSAPILQEVVASLDRVERARQAKDFARLYNQLAEGLKVLEDRMKHLSVTARASSGSR